MKPSKLVHHLNTAWTPTWKKTMVGIFWENWRASIIKKTAAVLISNLNEKGLLACYLVAFHAAKVAKPCTIAKNLILPAALDIVDITPGKQEIEKLESIPLSDNTIQHTISNITTDVRDQVRKNKESAFASLVLRIYGYCGLCAVCSSCAF